MQPAVSAHLSRGFTSHWLLDGAKREACWCKCQRERQRQGAFVTKDALKMARLEERIAFLCARYGRQSLPKTEPWWTAFQKGVELRNSLTHPKSNVVIDAGDVERYLLAILELIEFLFRKIYKKKFPLKVRGIQSKLTF